MPELRDGTLNVEMRCLNWKYNARARWLHAKPRPEQQRSAGMLLRLLTLLNFVRFRQIAGRLLLGVE